MVTQLFVEIFEHRFLILTLFPLLLYVGLFGESSSDDSSSLASVIATSVLSAAVFTNFLFLFFLFALLAQPDDGLISLVCSCRILSYDSIFHNTGMGLKNLLYAKTGCCLI